MVLIWNILQGAVATLEVDFTFAWNFVTIFVCWRLFDAMPCNKATIIIIVTTIIVAART